MQKSLVTINLVVLNGEKYIRHCLNTVLKQTYSHELIELNIWDNGSHDDTIKIIKEVVSFDKLRMPKFFLHESKKNLGMWPAQEELLKYTNGKYVLVLAVDVILDPDFIKNAIEVLEKDSSIGSLQAKIYKFDLADNQPILSKIIDTCGFEIYKSRRVANIGHGQQDQGQFSKEQEIFGVEGAAPIFRREALEDCRINGEIIDHDYFWYGDDLDLAWRMRLFGWKEVFAPSVIAWHDRQTTKNIRKNWADYIKRVPIRKEIPIQKRAWDWRNLRWTIVKNDYKISILKDLAFVLPREVAVIGYALLFERGIFKEFPNFLRMLPKMIKKRNEIMRKAKVGPQDMKKWFTR